MKTLLALLAGVSLLTATTASAREVHHRGSVGHRGGYGGGYGYGGHYHSHVGIGLGTYYGGPYYDGYDGDPGVAIYDDPGFYYYHGHRYSRGGGFRGGHSSHGHSSHGSSSRHHR